VNRTGGRIVVLLLTAAVAPAPLLAQSAPEPSRLAVLATVGAMRPSAAAVRDLYSGTFMPMTIEADVRAFWRIFVFASGQFLGKDGEIVFSLPPAPEEHFSLKLDTSSIRFGAGVAFPLKRWLVSAQAGMSYTAYEEKWIGEEIPAASGHAYGFTAAGGVDYRVYGRIWAVGRFEYSYTPIGEVLQTIPVDDLSGISVSGGVAVRF
jgi:hypothetical protein